MAMAAGLTSDARIALVGSLRGRLTTIVRSLLDGRPSAVGRRNVQSKVGALGGASTGERASERGSSAVCRT